MKHCHSTNLGCARHSSRLKSWLCSRWHEMSFFIAKSIASVAMVIPVYHCYGSAVPSVQWRYGNYAIRKFLSSLGNFSSRMVKDHAKNIPTESKGATPWRTPVPTRTEPSLLGLCRVQPGEDRRSTPIRLLWKPYTPIVPLHKHACL